LSTAKSQLASLQLSSQASVITAQNAVTSAQNGRDAKLAADQQAIAAAQRQVAGAQAAYSSAVAANSLKEAPAAADQLAQAEAAVASAQNQATTAQANYNASTLTAPADGTVTAVNGRVGLAASVTGAAATGATGSGATSSSSPFVSIVDFSHLEAKVGFSEADAAKVAAGKSAVITFDSLPGVRLTGTVRTVDLTATTVSNVVTYFAYITIDDANAAVKTGMTASVTITISATDNVLELPISAVTARGTTATVNVERGNDPAKTTPTQITLGARGDSTVQIASGLVEGAHVVVVRAAATGTSGAGSAQRPSAFTGGGPAAGGGRFGG
jgi:multidrug efflux pump subunit AcrA (membrane-fusion protein)